MPEGGRILITTSAVRLDDHFCDDNGLRADVIPVPGKGRTILVAEDELQVRELATRVLEQAGFRVVAT